ncbi:MAG: hypothetical protein QM479_01520 [Pseudomonadota bacterium]
MNNFSAYINHHSFFKHNLKAPKTKIKQLLNLIMGLFLCSFGLVSAAPIIWNENGHYYDVVEDAPRMSWKEAMEWAYGLSYTDASGQLFKGYLATITSPQEDNFIASLNLTQTAYLLGGYQKPATDETTAIGKKANWHWITDELWGFTNWRSGEPNNFFRWVGVTGAGLSEEFLQYMPTSTSAVWNDVYTGIFTDDEGEHFFGSSNFIVEYEAAPGSDPNNPNLNTELFSVNVEGRNVLAEWPLMPEAHNYILYYASAGYNGDVDMATLGEMDMGQEKNIFVHNLPSGSIYYAAVKANTEQEAILSNIVKFMPLGGSVSYPQSGEVLMQIDDPEGIGVISVLGTRNTDGSNKLITKIIRTDDTGSRTLYFTDNKPTFYEASDYRLNFVYKDDGSGYYEVILNNSKTRAKKTSTPNFEYNYSSSILCGEYKNADDYLNNANAEIESDTSKRLKIIEEKVVGASFILQCTIIVLEARARESNIFDNYMHFRRPTLEEQQNFLLTNPAFDKLQRLVYLDALLNITMESWSDVFKDTKQKFLDNYLQQCNDVEPEPEPDSTTGICPIDYDELLDDENDGIAGYWLKNAKCLYDFSINPHPIKGEYPYLNGELDGEVIKYYKGLPSGIINYTQEYINGVKEGKYKVYDKSGQMTSCKIYANGNATTTSCMP